MSGLRSAIEEYTAPDLSALTDAELATDATELARAIDILTHRLAMLAYEAAKRGAYKIGGFLNVTRWLAVMGDLDNGSASRLVRLGRVLSRHEETRRRSASRRLSQSRIRILARAARAHPDQYAEHEEMLLSFADE